MANAIRGDEAFPSPAVIEHRPVDYPRTYSAEPTFTLMGVSALLWRRRWLIGGAVLATMVLALAIAKQITPMYTADGAMVIASRKLSIPELETLITPTGDAAIVRSEISVLGSRTLLRDVAAKLKLDENPEFNSRLRPPDDSLLAQLDPRPWLRKAIGTPSGPPADESAMIDAEVEATLARNLDVVNDGRDYVIRVLYHSQDPQLSSAIVNTLMQSYLAQYAQTKVAATIAANASLNARAQELKREIEEADTRVEDFMNRTGVVETRLGSVSSQQLADLNTQLTQARADRAVAEARYAEALAGQRNGGVAANADVLASPLIAQLRQQEAETARLRADLATRLGPQHPDLKAATRSLQEIRGSISAEIAKVTRSTQGQVEVARARESTLQARINALTRNANSSAQLQDQLQRLKDDAASKRKVYDEFLVRVAQTAKPEDQQQSDVRVISEAVAPINPSSPRVMLITLLSGVIGGLLAVAGVLAWNQLDHGFESLRQVRNITGLPGIAAVPLVRRLGRQSLSHRYVLDHPNSPLAEALRALRAKLRWAARSRPMKSILVSSAVPREGKTSFALAFARLAARDGYKVLLLECDFRRPTLDGVLPPEARQRTTSNTSDHVRDPSLWRDGITKDSETGLDCLLAADTPRDLSFLLETGWLDTILADAEAEYDFIVVDSPPIMRVPDAMLLARAVDAVALVVWWRHTRQRLVQEALTRLAIDPDKPTGIVLTKVEPKAVEQDAYSGYSR